jgi:uncharacterized membrane protein YvbJ
MLEGVDMNCKICGASLSDDAKFCAQCGARLGDQPTHEVLENKAYPRFAFWGSVLLAIGSTVLLEFNMTLWGGYTEDLATDAFVLMSSLAMAAFVMSIMFIVLESMGMMRRLAKKLTGAAFVIGVMLFVIVIVGFAIRLVVEMHNQSYYELALLLGAT